ncbi:hypothetical protein A0257_19250 [Hymenobacter psoromatis]|nr:hypothetical protein A0257_19250 [Hymenobacter psoromatis]
MFLNFFVMANHYFRLNGTDFGIGSVQLLLPVTEQLLTLKITGSEEVTEAIITDEAQAFNWILYPPMIYFTDVPYALVNGIKTLTISEELSDNYDIALYLMMHDDLTGTLSITADNIITFSGTAQLDGADLPLEIFCVATS